MHALSVIRSFLIILCFIHVPIVVRQLPNPAIRRVRTRYAECGRLVQSRRYADALDAAERNDGISLVNGSM